MSADLEHFLKKLMPSTRKLTPSGWSVAPGNSVSITGPVKGVFSAGGEGGDFTVTNQNRPDKYKFKYLIGGLGAGLSFPIPDAQWFPSFKDSGNLGNVMRVPPHAPKATAPSGGSYEDGPPIGLEGGAMVLGYGGLAGTSAASLAFMFMGHIKPPRTLEAMAQRILLDTGLKAFGPLGQMASFIKNFQYVTAVWCTGFSSPQLSIGVSLKFGRIWK